MFLYRKFLVSQSTNASIREHRHIALCMLPVYLDLTCRFVTVCAVSAPVKIGILHVLHPVQETHEHVRARKPLILHKLHGLPLHTQVLRQRRVLLLICCSRLSHAKLPSSTDSSQHSGHE